MTAAADRKAIAVTGGFTAVALFYAWRVRDWDAAAPLLVLYAILLVSTYFSIRCFSRITKRGDGVQLMVDLILGVLYLWLASTIAGRGDYVVPYFFLVLSLVFAVATLKYVLLLTPDAARRP